MTHVYKGLFLGLIITAAIFFYVQFRSPGRFPRIVPEKPGTAGTVLTTLWPQLQALISDIFNMPGSVCPVSFHSFENQMYG